MISLIQQYDKFHGLVDLLFKQFIIVIKVRILLDQNQNGVVWCRIAAVSIRAEVTAQADDVILYSDKSELFVQM